MSDNVRGFTLLEMLIAVSVLTILAAIALPTYTAFIQRSNRSEAQAYLMDVAARQERFFTQNSSYVTGNADISRLGVLSTSSTGLYQLSVTAGAATDGGFLLTATAAGKQAGDTVCSTFTLNALGVKGSTGSGATSDCWR